MDQKHFEQVLSRRLWTKRIISLAAAGVLFAACAGFGALCSANRAFLPLVCICGAGTVVAICISFLLFAFSRFRSVTKDAQYLTVYRGLIYNIVYVDGTEKGRTFPLPNCNYSEVWLADRVKASVYFTKSMLNLAHISFSDHTANMEL